MKNIEQILKEAGIEVTDEQKSAVNKAVTENYRTINDYNNQVKKTEKAEGERDTLQGQLTDAQETLKSFDGVDVDGFKQKISDLEAQIKKRDDDAKAEALSREQKKVLDAKLDELGVTAPLMREMLFGKVTGKDGLPFRNGEFPGLADYLSKLNEENHFYQTEDEKKAAAEKAAEEEAKQKAAGSAPKFTTQSEGKPAGGDNKPTFNFGFTPVRAVSKGD